MSANTEIKALLFITLLSVTATAVAYGNTVNVKHELKSFQTLCLKQTKSCQFMDISFPSSSKMVMNRYSYIPLDSHLAFVAYNHAAKSLSPARSKHDGVSRVTTSVDLYDAVTNTWRPIKGSSDCKYCITQSITSGHDYWIRLTQQEIAIANSDTMLAFDVDMERMAKRRVMLVVRHGDGVKVYTEARANSIHLPSMPMYPDGSFKLILDGDWVKSAEPDYASVSTTKSWRDVARAYVKREEGILKRPNNLPVFSGLNHNKIIKMAVNYIESIKWDGTPQMRATYPTRDVSDIIHNNYVDCKAATTLLQALLRKSGITSNPVFMNLKGLPPVSFNVPSHWANHVILYVPSVDAYIDMIAILSSKGTVNWESSTKPYYGDIALDAESGNFVVLH